MPRVLIQEIKGYIGKDDYYCPRCGVELGFNNHIDHLLTEDDIEKTGDSSVLYCNKCGEIIA